MTMPIADHHARLSQTAQAAAVYLSYGHPAYTRYAEILIRRIERRTTEKAKREAEMLRTLMHSPAQIDDLAEKSRALIGELLRTQDALYAAIEEIEALEARAEQAEAKLAQTAYLLDEAGAELIRTRTREELTEWANREIRQ